MTLGTNDIYSLIKFCQNFNNNLNDSPEAVKISESLDISRITYRVIANGINESSDVIYTAPAGKLGENYDYTRNTTNTKVIILRIHRFPEAHALDPERKTLLNIFAEIIISGISVMKLISAYEDVINHDVQTGITNINYFKAHLVNILRSSQDYNFTVGYINIKNCRILNKIFGVDVTDKLIIDFAQNTLDVFESKHKELFSRLGGDNFIFVADNRNIDKILKYFSKAPVSIEVNNDIIEYNIQVRAGMIDLSRASVHEPGFAINAAADALAQSKKPGSPDFIYYSENTDAISSGQREFVDEIKKDLEDGKFLVYYQPIVEINEDKRHPKMVGAEALIRWRKKDRMVNPMSFIPVAEKYNFINKIDMFVLNKVCAMLKEWISKGYDVVPISCNFSQNDLLTPDLPDRIISTIDRHGIDHGLINIEFTEAGFHAEYEALYYAASKLISEGVKVSIDNFGTGYSSFHLLENLNFDFLKIDMTFVNSPDTKSTIIFESIIKLANELGLTVICEGNATEREVENAVNIGCSLFQTEHFEKALSERYFLSRLKNPQF